VLVLVVARKFGVGGQVVIGWHSGAGCLAECLDRPSGRYGLYNFVASSKTSFLLPPEQRTWAVPKGKGGMGQANVFYDRDQDGESRDHDWLRALLGGVDAYKGPSLLEMGRTRTRPTVQVPAEGHWLHPGELPLQEEAGVADSRSEGASRTIVMNRYERDPQLRAACIRKYGARCFVCAIDMGRSYGDDANGLIHVHHLTPLSELGGEADVDPVRDLRPLCPNCHSVVHRKARAFTMDEMRAIWSKYGGRKTAAEQALHRSALRAVAERQRVR
jgi:5-methylcytosine-specific restriction endonuclease McrA